MKDLEATNKLIKDYESQIVTLSKKIRTLEAESKTYKSRLETKEASIKALQARLTTAQENLRQAQENLRQEKKINKEAKQVKRRAEPSVYMKQKNATLTLRIESQATQIEELKKDLNDKNTQLALANQQIETLKTQKRAREDSENSTVQSKLQKMQEDHETEVTNLRMELIKLRTLAQTNSQVTSFFLFGLFLLIDCQTFVQ